MNQNWEGDFPIDEEVEDCCGSLRRFCISCYPVGLGYTIVAVEEGVKGVGYEFRAYSETSPYSALGRVREKIRRSLARRDISRTSGAPELLHDRMRGRITSCEQKGLQLVVDGQALDVADLTRILSMHEGWEFELRILDALD
jgi:hypothetical protein